MLEHIDRAEQFMQDKSLSDLEEQLGRSVDLVSEDGLLPFARPYVDHDKILLYERAH
jgi:hypothetical protein